MHIDELVVFVSLLVPSPIFRQSKCPTNIVYKIWRCGISFPAKLWILFHISNQSASICSLLCSQQACITHVFDYVPMISFILRFRFWNWQQRNLWPCIVVTLERSFLCYYNVEVIKKSLLAPSYCFTGIRGF